MVQKKKFPVHPFYSFFLVVNFKYYQCVKRKIFLYNSKGLFHYLIRFQLNSKRQDSGQVASIYYVNGGHKFYKAPCHISCLQYFKV